MCKAERQPLLGAEVGSKKEERKGEEGGEGGEEEDVENCRSWLVVLASFLCICMLDGSMYSNGVFTNTLIKALEASQSAVAGAASLEVAVSSVVAPLAAYLTDRYGPRSVALAGAATAASGWFVASWATGLLGLIGGQSVLTGIGFGLMYIPGVVAVAGVFSKRRSLAIGLALCGSGAGQVLLGPLVGALLEVLGWRNAFRVMSALCLGCGVAGLLMPTPSKKKIEAGGEGGPDVTEVGVWKARVLGRCIAVQEQVPVFLLYALGDGFAVMALYIPYSCIPDLANSSGISPTLATLLIASLGVGSVVGRLSSGWLCDQPWVKPLNLTRMAITVAAPIPLIYAMSPPCFLLLAGLCCLLGLVTGAWISATSPLLVTLLGLPQLGTAFGRLTAVRGVAALASPPLAAMMAEHMGMPLLPLYLSSALFAASTLLFSIAVLVYDRKMKKYSLYEQI